MELTRQDVMAWAPADVLAEGAALQSKGVVTGTRAQGEILAGAIKMGASRLVAQVTVRGGKAVAAKCPCGKGRTGAICAHVVAVGLQWAHDHAGEQPEAMAFAAERAPTRAEIERWAGPVLLRRAEELVKRGQVSRLKFEYPTGSGYVVSGGAPILVTFTMLKNGLVEGHCPCETNSRRGMLCEHIIATALGVMHRFGGEERVQARAAERAFMSPSRFIHLFKAECGVGYRDYLLRLKLREARRYLLGGNWPMSFVAANSGFADQSYFSAMFRREYGLSPLAYRRKFGRGRTLV